MEKGTLEIGKIKWAFGFNYRKFKKNDMGIIETSKHESKFLVSDVVKTSSLLENYKLPEDASRVEDEYVVFEDYANLSYQSGYGARHVQLLDEVTSDFLREYLKPEMFDNSLIKSILLGSHPDIYLNDKMEDYFPDMNRMVVRRLFNEKLRKGAFKENVCSGLMNYFQLKETVAWPASNWEYFDFSKENIDDLRSMYLMAKKYQFDVKPLLVQAPRIWTGSKEIINDVPSDVIRKYYTEHKPSHEEFEFLMNALNQRDKEWLARKVDRSWIVESEDYLQFWNEADFIKFIRSVDFSVGDSDYRKKTENVFKAIDPLVIRDVADELVLVVERKADSSWDSFLPSWARNPSLMPVSELCERKPEIDAEEMGIKEEPVEEFADDPAFQEYLRQYGITREFSVDQRRAIQAIDGVYLLFAVPGSGKTTVIINRIAYMVYGKHKIKPESILCMTFGRDATDHMRDEYISLTKKMTANPGDSCPQFKTIHGLCNQIIRKKMENSAPNLIQDSVDTFNGIKPKSIIRKVYEEYLREKAKAENLDSDKSSDSVYRSPDEKDELTDRIASAIGYISNRCLMDFPDEIRKIKIMDEDEQIEIAPIYNKYQEYLENNNLRDHDRSQTLAFEILTDEKNKGILEFFQNQYKYICVDEAQDVNTIQYRIIKLLVGDNGNLFMVGDDDQSIYGFRGADPQEMLAFRNVFPSGELLKMGTNYRSRPAIVSSAESFIKHNLKRENKQMKAYKTDSAVIQHLSFPNMLAELQYIVREANRIQSLPENLAARSDNQKVLAILYRKNISALPVMAALVHNHVPFKTDTDKLKRTFDNFRKYGASKDLICLLRLTQNPTDMGVLSRCYPALGAYLSAGEINAAANAINRGDSVFSALRYILGDTDPDKTAALNNCEAVLERVRGMRPYDAICEIMNRFGYEKRIRGTSQWFSIYTLLSMALYSQTIPGLLREIDELGDNHNIKNTVVLTTMHSSKGQQYEKVIILDAIEDFIPGNARMGEDYSYDPEEERRIFYVALTRAESELDILHLNDFYGHYYSDSSFVDEYVRGNLSVAKKNSNDTNANWGLEQMPKRTYYVVKDGDNPGIYFTEEIAKKKGIITNIFNDAREAELYLHRCLGGMKLVSVSNGLRNPVDLPAEVTKGLYGLFGVSELLELSFGKRRSIRQKVQYLFTDRQDAVDYSNCAGEYALVYLPVNFYKIWVPLYSMTRMQKLPFISSIVNRINILELGAGPGTSTLSVLQYYYLLAEENNTDVYIDYTVVEYEAAFLKVLQYMVNCYFLKYDQKTHEWSKDRLHCRIFTKKGDAMDVLKEENREERYNLIVESNMLNNNEHVDKETTKQLSVDLPRCLKNYGLVILIEPADKRIDMLEDLSRRIEYTPRMDVLLPDKYAETNLTKIKIYRDTVERGFRPEGVDYHKFRYAVYQKR